MDRIAFFGDTTKNWNRSHPTMAMSPPHELLRTALLLAAVETRLRIRSSATQPNPTAVYTGSQPVEMSDTVLAAGATVHHVGDTRFPNTTAITLGWFAAYNPNRLTGQSLTIRGGAWGFGDGGCGLITHDRVRNDPQISAGSADAAKFPQRHQVLRCVMTCR